jgi:hypothetical protein
MYGNDELVQSSLDNDLGDATFVDTGSQVSTDLVILDKLDGIILLITVPVTLPSTDDA